MAAQARLGDRPRGREWLWRYRERMSFRRILLLLLVIGAVVAVRNATADRGGSYDPNRPDA